MVVFMREMEAGGREIEAFGLSRKP